MKALTESGVLFCPGAHTGGDEAGVHQEAHLPGAVAGGVRPRRRPPHRVRAAVLALLDARAGGVPHLPPARAHRRQDVPPQKPQHPRQGPRQGRQEEGTVIDRRGWSGRSIHHWI